jgi:NAD(P)-dependent dehydrogenase (short-subunit alcohol dehydrogenase family)
MELEGRVALVTGAGRGIGRAIARRLSLAGAAVAVNDLDPAAAQAVAGELSALGRPALAGPADVSDPAGAEALIETVTRWGGGLDILVNNAGVGGAACLVESTPVKEWRRTLEVNLGAAFYCCRAAIPHLTARQGRIVNVASLAARRVSKLGGADYTAAKYGLVGFSRHLAFELAGSGVTVNVLCPGPTLTELIRERTSQAFRDQVAGQVPLGRWIEPEEQAEAVLFLVGPGAAMITGLVLDVDGGQLLGLAADYREDLARRVETSRRRERELNQGGSP